MVTEQFLATTIYIQLIINFFCVFVFDQTCRTCIKLYSTEWVGSRLTFSIVFFLLLLLRYLLIWVCGKRKLLSSQSKWGNKKVLKTLIQSTVRNILKTKKKCDASFGVVIITITLFAYDKLELLWI